VASIKINYLKICIIRVLDWPFSISSQHVLAKIHLSSSLLRFWSISCWTPNWRM